ncbi:MAG TPA: bifunctional (p)ppGpp synthetase/guanosine-3',5'-bis(diphosphate) 3'-pyrophosphohydrolase [Bdellovibrionota bacterium]|nr:bifunctional (p)ppGpp synthetase/guanosine-3',5'-bis(diphosphate) 3'-pyrophosphohydrolase [Bdellovibrionota bacterium]
MIPLDSILEDTKKYNADEDLTLIREAYEFSRKAHEGQKRKSGDPYFTHPSEVAKILSTHRLDAETIATGLLHDVVEDTLVTIEEVRKKFGPNVAQLVDGVTKLSKVSFGSKDVRQAESFRKMLLAMAHDIRVIVVKLADRLHNMRTLRHMPEMRQLVIAQETLDIYAPLANRLGIAWIKLELEELSFKALRPVIYETISKQLQTTAAERDRYIAHVIQLIGQKMKAEGVRCEVSGRAKHSYSIYKKMESRNIEFEQVADILAFRIIVDSMPQCYEVLGHIHTLWKPVPGRFKDYIALPKANLYQSLHTTVTGPEGQRIEVQIRTREMHQVAEDGIAAHWIYKTGEGTEKNDLQRFGWLRQMIDWEQDTKDSHEFIETVKLDLFADEVFVFTPRGEVYNFPRGATPIDFAYRVHTEVGHHCHGARINGRMVPLKYKLQNGDRVEILTSDTAKPSKDWLKIAITSKAKSKVRGVIKKEERDTGRAVGREILEKELKKFGENYEKLLASGKIKPNLAVAGYHSLDELLLALGYGKVVAADVISHFIAPDKLKGKEVATPSIIRSIISKVTPKQPSGIKVGGLDNVMVRYGKCCDPLPGDPILGFVTRGRGVTVHRTDCYKVLEVDSARRVDVEWSKNGQAVRNVKIKVVSVDSPGILADISKAISLKGGNISHASIRTTEDRKAINTFDVDVTDTSQLYSMMRSIEKLRGILSVERVKA